MELNEYQRKIEEFDCFKGVKMVSESGFMAKVLGLCGESGEVAEKFKKILRDKNGEISEEDKIEIEKELGDVLWYVATIARYIGVPLGAVAEKNVEKLKSRSGRGKIHGKGDNR